MGQELTAMNIAQVPMGESRKPGGWNFVAFTGMPRARRCTSTARRTGTATGNIRRGRSTRNTFHLGGPYFVPNEALTLIRDFRLYSRADRGTGPGTLQPDGRPTIRARITITIDKEPIMCKCCGVFLWGLFAIAEISQGEVTAAPPAPKV